MKNIQTKVKRKVLDRLTREMFDDCYVIDVKERNIIGFHFLHILLLGLSFDSSAFNLQSLLYL